MGRADSQIWALRLPRDGYSGGYVRCAKYDDDKIEIMFPIEDTNPPQCYVMTVNRADARLYAKRINQCLDDTARR